MNANKLSEATRRLEALYWCVLREGVGPSCELLAIWRLLEEAAKPEAEPEEEETVWIGEEPPQPAA